MSATDADFEKYDKLKAEEAHKFLLDLDDPETLRRYIAHEKEREEPRSTVLTDEVIDAALLPYAGDVFTAQEANLVKDADDEALSELIANAVAEGIERGLPLPSAVTPATTTTEEGDMSLKDETARALLEERRGYEERGDDKRVEEVNAQLKKLGAAGSPRSKRATTR